MATVNSKNCVTNSCTVCSFYQMEETSLDNGTTGSTIITVCKPNYILIGTLVGLIIVAPYIYKKYKNR